MTGSLDQRHEALTRRAAARPATPSRGERVSPPRRFSLSLLLTLLFLLAGCSTVGVVSDEQPYAVVEPTIAYEMILDNKQIVVLDIRPIDEFYGELGHLSGALSVPIDRIDDRLAEILPYRSQTVLVYGDAQEEVQQAMHTLTAAGFRNLVLVRGGIRRWIDLGYKTVKGI